MSKQIFGFPARPSTDWTRFIEVFDVGTGVHITLRDNDLKHEMNLQIPYDEAAKLACQLNMASCNRLLTARGK